MRHETSSSSESRKLPPTESMLAPRPGDVVFRERAATRSRKSSPATRSAASPLHFMTASTSNPYTTSTSEAGCTAARLKAKRWQRSSTISGSRSRSMKSRILLIGAASSFTEASGASTRSEVRTLKRSGRRPPSSFPGSFRARSLNRIQSASDKFSSA